MHTCMCYYVICMKVHVYMYMQFNVRYLVSPFVIDMIRLSYILESYWNVLTY